MRIAEVEVEVAIEAEVEAGAEVVASGGAEEEAIKAAETAIERTGLPDFLSKRLNSRSLHRFSGCSEDRKKSDRLARLVSIIIA